MNVIFTCGGTAGHVNPALALAGYMQERHPDLRVLFVGTPRGMERGLIEKAGYDFRSIEVSSFQRSLSPSGIAHNVKSLKNLALAGSRARAILRDFRPDLVVGTGGYASYPVVHEAAKRGIVQDILLEVNAGGEKQKSGFLLKEFPRIVEEMADYPAVRVRGLMTVPPIGRKKGDNCRYFQKIRRIAVDITAQKYDNIFMDFLSMGMTDDFEDAIACGSTMVRIGTAIFGPRNYAPVKSD